MKKETQILFEKVGKIKAVRGIAPENQLRGTYRLEGEPGTLTPENLPLIQAFQITEDAK